MKPGRAANVYNASFVHIPSFVESFLCGTLRRSLNLDVLPTGTQTKAPRRQMVYPFATEISSISHFWR